MCYITPQNNAWILNGAKLLQKSSHTIALWTCFILFVSMIKHFYNSLDYKRSFDEYEYGPEKEMRKRKQITALYLKTYIFFFRTSTAHF